MVYNDLHKGRVSDIGRAYFVTTVTHQREKLFTDLLSARIVINVMKQLQSEQYVSSLSWVLMPDHLHWLFRLGGDNDVVCSNEFEPTLALVMKRLKAVSARRVNQHLKRNGSVWQKAYYDRGLKDGEDIKVSARYICANPLRAGLVQNIGEYSFWDSAWL
jgi:REP-associated tyrosine transposase